MSGQQAEAEMARPGWRQAPRWMKVLLVASLSLNVLVAGVIGGEALRKWHGERYAAARHEPGLDARQARLLRMVPERRREEVRRLLLARQAELDAARREMREASLAFIDALRAEPFDPERVAAALARRQQASQRFWTLSTQQVAEIAHLLDDTERRELANRLEERTRRFLARMERRER